MKIESDGLSMCVTGLVSSIHPKDCQFIICLTKSTTRFNKSFLIEVALLFKSGLPRSTYLFKRHGGS